MEELIIWLEDRGHTQALLARRLGITRVNIQHWMDKGVVPFSQVPAVVKITGLDPITLNPGLAELKEMWDVR